MGNQQKNQKFAHQKKMASWKKKPNSFYDGTEQKKRGLKFFARMDVQKKKKGH